MLLLSVVTAAALLLGSCIVYGARVVHPVEPADAVALYQQSPSFGGVPGFDRELRGTRPLAGTYLYATTGGSRVDRLGIHHDYPATSARLVQYGPGCQWRESLRLFAEHTETYSACAQDGEVYETGFGTRLVHLFIPIDVDVICLAPGSRTGAGLAVQGERRFHCTDTAHDVVATGTVTYLGPSSAQVGTQRVDCRRVRIVTVLTGDTEGAASRELCTLAETGLVVEEARAVALRLHSAVLGRFSYTESATFHLLSLTPLT